MIGQTISHYKIQEKLGEGGMGVVFKAHDTQLNRIVALKFLPDRVTKDESAKARFIQEAQAAAALNHANICTIFNVEESDGALFMVMEYIEGGTLRNKVPYAKADEAIAVAIQIGEALQEAHSKGIVHRDIKADNIMLTAKGQVKVMDFGLAKLKGALKLTKTSSTVGTLGYMAPEQIQGGAVDHRSDIFAFGVLLFEMLTGKLPFRGEHEAAMVYSIVNEEPQDISQLVQDVSPIIANLIQRCLEKDPAARYQHFDDITADLKRSQQKTSKVARSVPSIPAPGRPAIHAIGRSSRRTLKPTPMLIAAAVVILATVGIYLFIPKTGADQKVLNVSQPVEEIKTLAVLPFVDMSPNKDQEYFSDGLAEELLNELAKNPKLQVTSRTSAFSFKGKDLDIKAIAAKLNVKHILEGSVRKAGNALRITTQLIDVEKDAHLWSQTYDGTMENVFAVQDTISRSVAGALNAALLGSAATPKRQETTPEAYNAYMLGIHFYDLSGKENLEKAESYFLHAISIDSGYARLWTSLAMVHMEQSNNGYTLVDSGYRRATREVEKALELDPDFTNAFGVLGVIKMNYNRDWISADQAFQHVLKVEPANRFALNGAASLAATLGRFDDAVKLSRHVVQVDPVWDIGYRSLALNLISAGLLDEADAALRKCLELNPLHVSVHLWMGIVWMERGKLDSALVEMQKETDYGWRLYALALIYSAMEKKKEADDSFSKFIQNYANVGAYQVAEVYAYRGEKKEAFKWLERAYAQRDGGLLSMKGDPLMRNLLGDPRYNELLKKLNLPV